VMLRGTDMLLLSTRTGDQPRETATSNSVARNHLEPARSITRFSAERGVAAVVGWNLGVQRPVQPGAVRHETRAACLRDGASSQVRIVPWSSERCVRGRHDHGRIEWPAIGPPWDATRFAQSSRRPETGLTSFLPAKRVARWDRGSGGLQENRLVHGVHITRRKLPVPAPTSSTRPRRCSA